MHVLTDPTITKADAAYWIEVSDGEPVTETKANVPAHELNMGDVVSVGRSGSWSTHRVEGVEQMGMATRSRGMIDPELDKFCDKDLNREERRMLLDKLKASKCTVYEAAAWVMGNRGCDTKKISKMKTGKRPR